MRRRNFLSTQMTQILQDFRRFFFLPSDTTAKTISVNLSNLRHLRAKDRIDILDKDLYDLFLQMVMK